MGIRGGGSKKLWNWNVALRKVGIDNNNHQSDQRYHNKIALEGRWNWLLLDGNGITIGWIYMAGVAGLHLMHAPSNKHRPGGHEITLSKHQQML